MSDAMTWNQWAQTIWPGLSESDASTLLWECTAFPLADIETIEKQIRELYASSGGNLNVAIDHVYAETDRIMGDLRDRGLR